MTRSFRLPHKVGEFVLGGILYGHGELFGGITHEVYLSRLRANYGTHTRGEGAGGIIRLDHTLRGQALADTVIHECLHGMFPQMKEGYTNLWGSQLSAVVCDAEIWERIVDA